MTVFRLAAFFCMSTLLCIIRPYFPGYSQLMYGLFIALAVGSAWNGFRLCTWMIGYCGCGQNPGPLFHVKLSRVTLALWFSALWLLAHIIAVKIGLEHSLQDRGVEQFAVVGLFFSMGLPYFLFVVSGQAKKTEDDIALVTSVDIKSANLSDKSKEELEYLLQLARDLDEEINATFISRLLLGK